MGAKKDEWQPTLPVFALSVALALCVGNWMRPLGAFTTTAAGTLASSAGSAALPLLGPVNQRLMQCRQRGEVYAAKLGDPEPFVNDFNASFLSPVNTAVDGTFLRMAMKAGTDKVIRHSYHYLYNKHLVHARFHDLNILEIGLGCFMRMGVGNSLKLWRAFFPCAKISFVEHMRECAEEHRDEVEKESEGKLYIGSQTDKEVTDAIVADAKKIGGFDMIVDDGAHFPDKQMFALEHLWPAVKPGGIYVVEDFYKYFQEPVSLTELPPPSSGPIPLFQRLLLMMNCDSPWGAKAYESGVKEACKEHQESLFRDVVNVDCMAEACVLVKGKPLSGF